jgi:DNA (cytosine-5)-methyltransferase 1
MRHGSLFSGIGGFDLAAQWMGWENIFHCEIAEFPRKILNHYWPNAECHEDIKKTDFTKYRGTVDIISGGFPCQPYSMAGKRKGKADERHLWPEMLRAIREIQPRWVVGENVLGLVNWDGGLVFEEVQADLESQGYEVQPYVLPACAVNAPHRRDRVWFVAHAFSGRSKESKLQQTNIFARPTWNNKQTSSDAEGEQGKRMRPEQRELSNAQQGEFRGNGGEVGNGATANAEHNGHVATKRGRSNEADSQRGAERQDSAEQLERIRQSEKLGSIHATPDASNERLQRSKNNRSIGKCREDSDKQFARCIQSNWQNFPTQSPVCSRDDGFSSQLDGITFPKWRNESIKAAGNAIVPQVAYQIFRAIELYEIQNGAK